MNLSAEEVAKFERLGAMWRDPAGPMRVLHLLNPLRTRWIADLTRRHHPAGDIAGLEVLDVGCGAGLLSENLAALGMCVTGIDPVERNIRLARAAAEKAGQLIEYRTATPEAVRDQGRRYDLVCALEVVEHVPDRVEFLHALGALVSASGLLFITTIDRTLLAWLTAIVAGEKILGILPEGTHRWDWFARPQEVHDVLAGDGLARIDLRGIWYAPWFGRVGWTKFTGVNWAGAWFKS